MLLSVKKGAASFNKAADKVFLKAIDISMLSSQKVPAGMQLGVGSQAMGAPWRNWGHANG